MARLEPLLARLERQAPTTALAWLQCSPAAPILHGLLAGEIAISHEALDRRDAGQASAYLRSWLVAEGILEQRDERLPRFERWVRATLDSVQEHPDRVQLSAYAHWKLRPELARRIDGGRARPSSHKFVYAKLRTAVGLTDWLHARGLVLGQLRQPLLDEWLAGSPCRALPTRDFLGWAHGVGLVPALQISRPPAQNSTEPIDQASRIRQARVLLHEESLEPAVRVSGCLVLLYGQQVTRIAALRTDAVELRERLVLLRLGEEPVEISEPLATLLRALRERSPGQWLLPGAKPGTHIGPERIRRRLRQLGIYPSVGRPGALLALGASVPAPILAELLGYCDDTANHWRRAAGGDWSRYASLASQATT